MRPMNYTLDRQQVHRVAADHLQAHLPFKDYKRKTSARTLWSLWLAAAARITSLSDACQRLRDAPSDETARKALLATLPNYAELQRQLNAALAGNLPKALRKDHQNLAIDLTLVPSHGRPFRDPDEVYWAQAQSGTSHFHAYATASIVRTGQRYTVALTGVRKGEPLKDVVQRLLRQAASVGIRPRLLLLDRGFSSVAVVRSLQAARSPFLMPVVCHGRSPKQPGGPSGSYVFRTWTKGGWSHYPLTDAQKRTATVSIWVKCRNYRGRRRPGRQTLSYASWGYRPPSPDSVFATYRLRFGIETSYRQMHQGRIRTTTRRPDVRLLDVGIALVLRNLWVWLHYTVLARPRRGGRVILLERLRWETLLGLLQVAEEVFGVADTTFTERGVPYELAVELPGETTGETTLERLRVVFPRVADGDKGIEGHDRGRRRQRLRRCRPRAPLRGTSESRSRRRWMTARARSARSPGCFGSACPWSPAGGGGVPGVRGPPSHTGAARPRCWARTTGSGSGG